MTQWDGYCQKVHDPLCFCLIKWINLSSPSKWYTWHLGVHEIKVEERTAALRAVGNQNSGLVSESFSGWGDKSKVLTVVIWSILYCSWNIGFLEGCFLFCAHPNSNSLAQKFGRLLVQHDRILLKTHHYQCLFFYMCWWCNMLVILNSFGFDYWFQKHNGEGHEDDNANQFTLGAKRVDNNFSFESFFN